jgi:hypothetical protein
VAVEIQTLSPVGIVVFALVSALVYYMIRNISTNKYIPLAIGIVLLLFTSGTLQTIGLGVTALGVSRIVEQEINVIESSSSG